ncbi:PREDICTED: lymphocyte cytosolic protein 2 [Cyprinodon variegatus]|uniref:lymphocyte cytosolic protein 2 n=1 Tax=Cyprinodon variegatus TaxID=28743 RepID=UPI000742581B|nr:PREDICTED: lymphocyte cytosolic protein 2 [Cyprinodon variegatus]
MSSVPYKTEVLGWNPQQLADYLKRMNLPGCDKVVLKNSINGARFVNLTDNDLQKFPKIHAPMISKLSSEISKKVPKSSIFGKKQTTKYNEPEMTTDGGWGEDEFDDEDFDDYESPYSDEDRDYESPDEELDSGNDYEPPPSEPADDLTHKLCPSQPIGDGDYIDRRDSNVPTRGQPPAVSPRPSNSTLSAPKGHMSLESLSRRDPSPHAPARPSGNFPPGPPRVCRDSKPGRDTRSTHSPVRGHQFNSADRPGGQSWGPPLDSSEPLRSKPPILHPPNSSVGRSNSSARGAPPSRFDGHREQAQDVSKHNTFPLQKSLPPRPGIPGPVPQHSSLPPSIPSLGSLPHKLQSAIAEHRGSIVGPGHAAPPAVASSEGLDPNWYVGKVTRGQAEGCLKRVYKDGAYLVRDSTKQLPNQPFTLMVFYQDKVYNIQIRQQNQQFQLGTGLKAQEFFPSVCDIINHYSHSPLVLIDAKNRTSSHQNQCLLSDPAGYYMTGQNWS